MDYVTGCNTTMNPYTVPFLIYSHWNMLPVKPVIKNLVETKKVYAIVCTCMLSFIRNIYSLTYLPRIVVHIYVHGNILG